MLKLPGRVPLKMHGANTLSEWVQSFDEDLLDGDNSPFMDGFLIKTKKKWWHMLDLTLSHVWSDNLRQWKAPEWWALPHSVGKIHGFIGYLAAMKHGLEINEKWKFIAGKIS